MALKYIIYALVDPRDGQIRYVGKSSSGLNRPKQHRHASRLATEKGHKRNWVKSLVDEGLDYGIEILQELNGPESLNEAEKYWIAKLRSEGARLTNLTDGGEGLSGWMASEETRTKMSKAAHARWGTNPPPIGERRQPGRPKSPERQRLDLVERAFRDAWTIAELAQSLNTSESTAWRALKDLGVAPAAFDGARYYNNIRNKTTYPTPCNVCNSHRRLEKNGSCWRCNRMAGLTECVICHEIRLTKMDFYEGYVRCKECQKQKAPPSEG